MTVDDVVMFGDRILVRPDPKIETSDGGLVIPDVVLADNPNFYTMTGRVLKLGDGMREDVYRCNNAQCGRESRRQVNERCPTCGATQRLLQAEAVRPFDVRVGDRVLFNRFAGKEIEVCDQPERIGLMGPDPREKLLIMREIEVLGVLDDNARVLPGYEAPNWAKVASNPGDRKTT